MKRIKRFNIVDLRSAFYRTRSSPSIRFSVLKSRRNHIIIMKRVTAHIISRNVFASQQVIVIDTTRSNVHTTVCFHEISLFVRSEEKKFEFLFINLHKSILYIFVCMIYGEASVPVSLPFIYSSKFFMSLFSLAIDRLIATYHRKFYA